MLKEVMRSPITASPIIMFSSLRNGRDMGIRSIWRKVIPYRVILYRMRLTATDRVQVFPLRKHSRIKNGVAGR